MSVYIDLRDSGCELDSHYSDLYVKATPAAWRIIKANVGTCAHVSTFINNLDGKVWVDIPFAFEPYWEAKVRGCASS